MTGAATYLHLTEGERNWMEDYTSDDVTPALLTKLADQAQGSKQAHRQQDNDCTSARYALYEFVLRAAAHQLAEATK